LRPAIASPRLCYITKCNSRQGLLKVAPLEGWGARGDAISPSPPSKKVREAVVGRKHLLQKLRLIPVLFLTITAAAYAHNISPPNNTTPPPPDIRNPPPAKLRNTTPPIPGVCPQLLRIGPFQTSHEAELAAQSARYQVLQASSVYSQGWPGSYFDPLKYFFDVYIFSPCN
jgi:hypothetical protein